MTRTCVYVTDARTQGLIGTWMWGVSRDARRMLVAATMCLVLGALGGLLAAEPNALVSQRARFVPPAVPAYAFRLRDQDGRWTTLQQARGKVLILTFLYSTCRDLCPAQAKDIVQAVQAVGGKGVEVYGVSVDPVGDTPARARAFLVKYGVYGGPVHFLVGSRRQLRPVWEHYGIVPINATPAEARAAAVRYDALQHSPAAKKPPKPYAPPSRSAPPQADQPYPNTNDLQYRGHARHAAGQDFEHSAYVMLIDKRGIQRVGIPFETLTPDGLATDLRTLLRER